MLLLDMHRVTGIDVSTMNGLFHIKQLGEAKGIELAYAAYEPEIGEKLIEFEAVSIYHAKPMLYPDTDFALEQMEENLLVKYSHDKGREPVENHLMNLLGCEQ